MQPNLPNCTPSGNNAKNIKDFKKRASLAREVSQFPGTVLALSTLPRLKQFSFCFNFSNKAEIKKMAAAASKEKDHQHADAILARFGDGAIGGLLTW